MRVHRLAPVALAAVLALAAAAAAQPSPHPSLPIDALGADTQAAPAPVSLAWVEGRADLVRPDGVHAAQAPDLLEEDDRLVTANGQAELILDDGSVVHVDRDSDVRVDLGVRVRLVRGRVRVHTPRDTEALYLALPAGPVRLGASGIYDLMAADLDGETVIAVVAGHAALITGDTEIPISPEDVLRVDPRDPRPRWERGTPRDPFVDWSDRRLHSTEDARHMALPPPVQPWAADLAANGQWSSMAPFGPVWFPSAGPEWRPYQMGAWRFTRYGWTWIDQQRWAWPVHHYGRWGHQAGRGWYWIPHRAWGPAWVGWAVAADHVAWSPLGWDRRPLVEFSAGARLGPSGFFASTWSILPRQAFGRRGWIDRDLTDPRYLPGPVLGGFVSQMIGPRGPAGPGDRFAVRPDRRAPPPGPRPSPRGIGVPSIPYQPVAPPAAVPRQEAAPYAPPRRRPMDAPPVDPVMPVPQPRGREWTPAPVDGAYGTPAIPRRAPRDQRPVGAPVRVPRGEAPAAAPPAAAPVAPAPPAAGPSWRPRGSPAGEGSPQAPGAGPRPRGAEPSAGPQPRAPRDGSDTADSQGARGQGGVRRRR